MSPEFMLRFPFPSHEVRLNKKHRARVHGVGSRSYGRGQLVQGGGLLRRSYDIATAPSASSAVYDQQIVTPFEGACCCSESRPEAGGDDDDCGPSTLSL